MTAGSGAPDAGIEIRLLGRFSARRDGEEIPPRAFSGRLVRSLIRMLAARPGAFVSRDVLTEALWPRRAPADPSANLTVLVNRARRALGDPSVIVTGPGGYSMAAESCRIDATEFLRDAGAGRQHLEAGRADAALEALGAAIDCWGGEPLPEDAYEDWAQEHRASLSQAYVDALENAARAALTVDAPRDAVLFAELAVRQAPVREAGYLLLMRALGAVGDMAGALVAFDTLRRRLRDDLGLDPSPDALELHMRIISGAVESSSRASIRSIAPAVEELPFVGREAELETAVAHLADPGAVVLVTGMAGCGKSRFLRELARRAEVPVVFARAFLPEREEPWALARSILGDVVAVDISAARELSGRSAQALARILPDIEDVRPVEPSALRPEAWRALAFEAARRLFEASAAHSTLVLVDDLQWADASSLVLLGSIMARVPRLSLVLAYRGGAAGSNETVAGFLADVAGLGRHIRRLSLGPLPSAAIADLILDEALVDLIVAETDATPLAVAEALRALVDRGAVEGDARRRWRLSGESGDLVRDLIRTGMRRTIRSRAQRLPPRQRRILALLALLARGAPAGLLAVATSEAQPRVLSDLDALADAALVDLGEQGWVIAHDLIADVIAADLDGAERRELHRMLAGALGRDRSDPAELARHLVACGDDEAASRAYAVAARASLDSFAAGEAERLATAGLALKSAATRTELLEIRAEGRSQSGNVAGAREDLRAALASRSVGAERSRILVRLAQLASGAADMEQASQLADLALAEAGDDAESRAQALRVGAIVDMNLGYDGRSAERFDQALVLFEQCSNARGIADILDGRAMGALLGGKLPEAAAAFDRVARLFTDTGDLLRVVVPRGTRGWTLALMGRPAEGLRDVDEALALCRLLGHPDGEAYALVLRSLVLTALDRTTEAVECSLEALSTAERIEHKGWMSGAFWALGEARRAAGQREQAVTAFRSAMEAAEGFPYFTSLTAATLASALVEAGELAEADTLVARALALGTPMSAYWARQARAELAVARGDPDAHARVAETLASAEAGVHMLSAARLRNLAASMSSLGVAMP